MKNSRKIIAGLLVTAGLVTAGAIAYADPEGYGPGSGGHHCGMAGSGMMGAGAMGPDRMAPGAMGPALMDGDHHGAMGSGMGGAWGGPTAHSEARLTFLKTQFKITPDQESAWQAYAKQAKQQAESMKAWHTQAHSTGAQSTPERLSQRAEFAKQRAASMEAMTAALKNLYAALTPEQKTIADPYFGGAHMSQFSPRGHRHGH